MQCDRYSPNERNVVHHVSRRRRRCRSVRIERPLRGTKYSGHWLTPRHSTRHPSSSPTKTWCCRHAKTSHGNRLIDYGIRVTIVAITRFPNVQSISIATGSRSKCFRTCKLKTVSWITQTWSSYVRVNENFNLKSILYLACLYLLFGKKW